MSELYRHIANTIRELRTGRGLSQETLAQQIEAAANTVSRWETGTYKPSADELERLARLFGVSISVFFPGIEQPGAIPPKAQALLSATRDLNTDDMDEIIRYAEFRRARRTLKKEGEPKRRRKSK